MTRSVGDYILLPVTLGKGSYATVCKAQHKETNETVAIKVMDRKQIEREKMDGYVKKEIAVMHSLKHPNIVELKDVLMTKSNVYLVLELVEGKELFDQVARQGALDENSARQIFHQLISAVEYLHSKGVCHRDLKLENCMIDSKSGLLKILDFGFSRHLESNLKTPVGTLTYMSPESLSGEHYDGKPVDIWACGVMLYTMVVGRYPFGEENVNFNAVYTRIKSANYMPFPAKISEEVKDLLRHIFVVDPLKRFAFEQIREHPWYQGIINPNPLPALPDPSDPSAPPADAQSASPSPAGAPEQTQPPHQRDRAPSPAPGFAKPPTDPSVPPTPPPKPSGNSPRPSGPAESPGPSRTSMDQSRPRNSTDQSKPRNSGDQSKTAHPGTSAEKPRTPSPSPADNLVKKLKSLFTPRATKT